MCIFFEPRTPGAGYGVADYFALCLACHHAIVATFVPTDVDSKVRRLLWRETGDREELRRMFALAMESMRWSLAGISTRGHGAGRTWPAPGRSAGTTGSS